MQEERRFYIAAHCICCGACALDCPVHCIERRGDQFYIIAGCISCGDCYSICPVGAVVMDKVNR